MATTVYPPTYGTALPRRTDELNDFVLAVLHSIDKGDPTDIITPRKPLWNRMKQRNGGMIERRPPGRGPVEDVIYQTPDRTYELSLSNDMVDEDYTTIEGVTQAKYDWVMMKQWLVIGESEYDNAQGPNAIVDLVKRKKKILDTSFQNKLNDRLWNGTTSGSEIVWGINDIIQFDPSSNPSKGAVGRLDATAALFSSVWRNKSNNFNAAYKTISSGTMSSNMLHAPALGLLDLWNDCMYANDVGEDGEPDLFVVNDVLLRYMSDLADTEKRWFLLDDDRYELGIPHEKLMFQSAQVLLDRSVPDDPNNSSYGVGLFINTRNLKFVWAEGLEKQWGEMEKIPGKAAYGWPCKTQYSVVCDARNRLGVFYGAKAASVS